MTAAEPFTYRLGRIVDLDDPVEAADFAKVRAENRARIRAEAVAAVELAIATGGLAGPVSETAGLRRRTGRKAVDAAGPLTAREVADRLGIAKPDGVHRLIATGELPAVNISRGKRATWRIDSADLDAFIETRKSKPPAPKPVRRRKAHSGQVTEYF